ncbi:MAG TPA: hypothetical protein VGL10_00650 [Gammaproteobacteria bacterium]
MSMQRMKTMRGQAMTEFVISAAFILVPLFILVPMLGKYIDMKHAAVQTARYEAWEYTANYASLADQSSGFNSVVNSKKPVKPINNLKDESRRRFFAENGTTLHTGADFAAITNTEIKSLWRYHDGLAMYDPIAFDAESDLDQNLTPDPTGVLSAILYVIDVVFSAIADILSAVASAIGASPVGFDAVNSEGYFKSTVSIPVTNPPEYTAFSLANTAPLLMTNRNLRMRASAGVLTQGWSAGGVLHTQSQAKGMVPTSLIGMILNDPIPLQTVVAAVLLSPELHPDSLEFGHMDIDAVDPSHLEGGGEHSCNDAGYCTY